MFLNKIKTPAPLKKIKPLYLVIFLALIILNSCDGCGCKTTCEGPTAKQLSVFGGGWQKIEVYSQCYQKCADLVSSESGIKNHKTQLFFVNYFEHEVIDVSEHYLEYDSLSQYQIITDSMAYGIYIDYDDGEGEQLYLWDYKGPVVAWGNKWAPNEKELINRHRVYADSIPFRRHESQYVDKNYYSYTYSHGSKFRESDTLNVFFRVNLKTGEAGSYREEGGRDISQWNNVVYAFGDFYGIDTKNIDTAYLYKYDMETKVWDSLFIDIRLQSEYKFLNTAMDVTFGFWHPWTVNPFFPYDVKTDLVITTIRGFYGVVINTSDFTIKFTGRLNYETTNSYVDMTVDDNDLTLSGYYDSIAVDITYKDWQDWQDGNNPETGVVDIPENR